MTIYIFFVGCLVLRQEISESLQKKSVQTKVPMLRKRPKTVSVPPLGGGWKGPPQFFLAGIAFVGFLNLMQEIFDSMQKESACFDLPILRKSPKTVSVPPLVGAEKAPHNFFGWDSLCGVSKHDARDFWLNAKGISLFRPPRVEKSHKNSVCGVKHFFGLDTLCRVSVLDVQDFWLIPKEISPKRPPWAEKTPQISVCSPLGGVRLGLRGGIILFWCLEMISTLT